jgi:hypothetical protein
VLPLRCSRSGEARGGCACSGRTVGLAPCRYHVRVVAQTRSVVQACGSDRRLTDASIIQSTTVGWGYAESTLQTRKRLSADPEQ